jgi:hypothetical protein
MKKLLLIALCLGVAGLIGCAKVEEAEAGGLSCDSHFGKYVLNKCVEHPQPEEKLEAGVGVDVKLWENDKIVVDQENKLNLNDGAIDEGDWSTYTVFKPKMEKGLLQTIGDFISGLFNKG